MEHIFEKYHQSGQKKILSGEQGWACQSLNISLKKIHHGRITVESKFGEGTCFKVIIPQDLTKIHNPDDKNDNNKI
jgi:signal transduction histidine kinase